MLVCAAVAVYVGTAGAQTFVRNLHVGDSGADVYALQVFLNASVATQIAASGPGSPGGETTYYGALTADAVRRLQEAHAGDILAPAGLSSGTGFFGPLTRQFVEALSGHTSVSGGSSDVFLPPNDAHTGGAPTIFSIEPSQGGIGTKITVHGKGFTKTGNKLGSAFEEFNNLSSSDGTTLTATIKGPFPKSLMDKNADFYRKNKFTMEYELGVSNNAGKSNFVPFLFTFY
jgi:peptidoglycan hydrolase-like protein with peptidoglycan-binding domain